MKVLKAKSFCISTIALTLEATLEADAYIQQWVCSNCGNPLLSLGELDQDRFSVMQKHFVDIRPDQYLELLIFLSQMRLGLLR